MPFRHPRDVIFLDIEKITKNTAENNEYEHGDAGRKDRTPDKSS